MAKTKRKIERKNSKYNKHLWDLKWKKMSILLKLKTSQNKNNYFNLKEEYDKVNIVWIDCMSVLHVVNETEMNYSISI